MTAYNISFVDTSNNIAELTDGIMSAINPYGGILILLGLFITIFVFSKKYTTDAAFLGASLTTSLIAILFFFMSWINFGVLIVPLLLTMAAFGMQIFGQ